MRFRLILGVLLLSLIQASGAVAAAPDFKALMRKELDAWETLDPTKVAAFYAKDADNTFFDLAPLKYKGWAEYEEGAKKVLADYASVKLTINDDAQVHQHGNLGWATATFHADFVTKSGGKEPMDARWTLVWEKRGKDWLIVHEHVSVPLPPAAAADQPLYKRLGGYDALAAVTDDFIPRLVHDPQLAKYFIGHSTESLHRIRQLVVDQLCAATGGPCLYVGRDMKSAHAGLGITESDWQAAANHLVESLDKFNVPEKEKKEVLDLVSTLKKDIVAAER